MNRVVLFSPVGGTDPMSQSNFHDGSMLHIARVYKPTEVYLYMSAEMLAHQLQDDRYRYCLGELAKLQEREIKIQVIEREKLQDVQQFDFFYDDFRQVLAEISADLDETDTLLLNVSSGTPAMKSGLLVIATLGEYPYKIIQVATPEHRMNEHLRGEYDVKLLWELNEDNREDFENRCLEVQCPSLSVLKHEQIIKKMVSAYDYEAAYSICALIPKERRGHYEPLLELAVARLRLDFTKVNLLEKEYNFGCIPIKETRKQKLFEYALNLDVKRKKGEYSDFIRAITPLVVDLFALVIEHNCGVKLSDYCYPNARRWDPDKLNGTEFERILFGSFSKFDYRYVYSIHLVKIMEKKLAGNSKILVPIQRLRDIEEKVRNKAAHEMVSLTEKIIANTIGCSSEDVMELIKTVFKYTDINLGSRDWQSYEEMNRLIIETIG